MKKRNHRLLSLVIVFTTLIANFQGVVVHGEQVKNKYELYPTPHDVTYQSGSFVLNDQVNVVYEQDIDSFTKARLEEVLAIKGIASTTSNEIKNNQQNILVGIHNSKAVVDTYFKDQNLQDDALFNKADSNIVSIKDGNIAILGKDSDSAFYGITSLKHIFNQLTNKEIANMMIKDYADVQQRGFIEGYYGDPWSVDDRADLMKYGGDYKLNQYIYAPKDDPYHNSRWRTLYDDEKLKDIERLAKAGNESKCYYVYALHTFMHSPVRFDSEAHYQEDLTIIKNKFTQVMNVGVRKFAILADDAGVPAGNASNYVKLMKDLTDWMIEKQASVPGLKKELLFCPNDYMGNGSSSQMQALKAMPDSVSLIQTGGKVWGEVSPSFTNTFVNNMGRAPFMWINWPCSDNTKHGLIMGGNERFLMPGVDPNKVLGIMLNPMQQAEANKSSLFAIADYGWNIWENNDQADQNWNDSFKYMDHGTASETTSSTALRELSKHMQYSNTRIPESKELGPKIIAFQSKLANDSLTKTDIDAMRAEFKVLQDAANNYASNPGNPRTRDQIVYWLNAWKDTSSAAIHYLNALSAIEEGKDANEIWSEYSQAQASQQRAKTYGFHYVDHQEYARVGTQYIEGLISKLGSKLSDKVLPIVNPNIQIQSYITNRNDVAASGNSESVFDFDDSTGILYKDPNKVMANDYFGVSYTKGIDVSDVRFVLAGGKNHFDHAKVQYTNNGKTWVDVNDQIYDGVNGQLQVVKIDNLALRNVRGLRIIATSNNAADAWPNIMSIDVNANKIVKDVKYTGTIATDKLTVKGGSINNINDVDKATFTHFAEDPYKVGAIQDYIPKDATITLSFNEAKAIGKVYFKQDGNSDRIQSGQIEYSLDGTTNWISLGNIATGGETQLDASDLNISAKALRIHNMENVVKSDNPNVGYWWKVYDFSVFAPAEESEDTTPLKHDLIKTAAWNRYDATGPESNLWDNDDNSGTEYYHRGDKTLVGDYIGYDLGRVAKIGKVRGVIGGNRAAGNKWNNYKLEYSKDNVTWTTFKEYRNQPASGKDTIVEDLNGVKARYVRFTNLSERPVWVIFSELSVEEVKDVASKKYLYTNTSSNAAVVSTNTMSKLTNATNQRLATNEYIGIRFERIKDINQISKDVSNANLTLQSSLNGIEWDTLTANTPLKPAAYIRFINLTKATINVDINQFEVYSNEVNAPSLKSATIGIHSGWGAGEDTRNNGAAFDGDINTTTEFADLPQLNENIIYDLGQSIQLNNIRLYVQDSAKNYIRDAKVMVSADGTTWNEVMRIGDGVENTNDGDTTVLNSGIYQTSSNYPNKFYVEGKDFKEEARYLKIEFTAPNNNRAVVFNEIILNKGEYIKTINDPTFVSDPIELRGFAPQNLIDGKLDTAYQPNTKNGEITKGSLTYRLKDQCDSKKLNIVQSIDTISNAKVMIRTNEGWKQIGKLSKSLNEFLIYDQNIFEIKIEWETVAPILYEIILVKDYDLPDLTSLKAAVDLVKNTEKDSYTTATYQAFEASLIKANEILNGAITSKENCDQVVLDLQKAFDALQLHATNYKPLEALLNECSKIHQEDYLYNNWETYSDNLIKANGVIAFPNAYTQSEVDQCVVNLQQAKDALMKHGDPTSLINLVNEIAKLNAANYTQDSWEGLSIVVDSVRLLLSDLSNATQTTVDEYFAHLQMFKNNLVDLTELRAAIKDSENNLGEQAYETDSWTTYLNKMQVAKTILAKRDASKIEVNAGIASAKAARNGLVEDVVEAMKVILEKAQAINNEDHDYSNASFDDLQAKIKEVEAFLASSKIDETKAMSLRKEIEAAYQNLVCFTELKDALNEYLDEKAYTNDSWKAYQEVIKTNEALLNRDNVSKQQLDDAIKAIKDAKTLLKAAKPIVNDPVDKPTNKPVNKPTHQDNGETLIETIVVEQTKPAKEEVKKPVIENKPEVIKPEETPKASREHIDLTNYVIGLEFLFFIGAAGYLFMAYKKRKN
ncbi:MAG: beta-N-acetylglucosaminidase domain-containing protein [Erysipelotrichaceae bacterium]